MVGRIRNRPEELLQTTVVTFLRLVCPDCLTFAIPNAARRSVIEGAAMKRSGTLAGIPDLAVVTPGGKIHFFELKSEKGKPSKSQRDIHALCSDMGVPIAVVRSLDEVRACLFSWGIKTREVKQ